MENELKLNATYPEVEKKKRGRKKLIKPEIYESQSHSTNNENGSSVVVEENINSNVCVIKKERKQRKTKNQKNEENKYNKEDQKQDCNNEKNEELHSTSSSLTNTIVLHKKRGRKPRGGKIIHENQIQKNNSPEVPNIILHLKCVLSDLKKSNELHSNKLDACSNDKKNEVLCYNDNDQNSIFSSNASNITNYENCNKNEIQKNIISEESTSYKKISSSSLNKVVYDPSLFSSSNKTHPIFNMLDSNNTSNSSSFMSSEKDFNISRTDGCDLDEYKNITNKEIWKKISQLKLNFHKNDSLSIQRSACFWDTCEFDTPPIHIPVSSTKGYGCFCHPECAVAFLMNENIDTSVKFERYYLLNSIYGPIYNYNKSIKPAPNPHYLLNKFYGNLTINEYRKMFECEQVVYIVNKPLTNVLPELYEDNNDFFVGNKIIQNNTIELKNKSIKAAKSSIINEVFGVK